MFDDYTERYTLRVGTELKDTERAQVAWILCGEGLFMTLHILH